MSSTQLAVLAFLTIYYQAVHARPAVSANQERHGPDYSANQDTPVEIWRVMDQAGQININNLFFLSESFDILFPSSFTCLKTFTLEQSIVLKHELRIQSVKCQMLSSKNILQKA